LPQAGDETAPLALNRYRVNASLLGPNGKLLD
jgi:hypothetical protein